jgi:hypothetical protein
MKKRDKQLVKKSLIWLVCIVLFIFLVLVVIAETCYENQDKMQKDYLTNVDSIDPKTIHIFMTFDEKYGENIGNKCAEINKIYADDYGFNFHVSNPESPGTVPHYKRYVELEKMGEEYPDGHYFVYIDGDASVVNQQNDIRKWFPEPGVKNETYILFGNEFNSRFDTRVTDSLRNLSSNLVHNSGVIIIKNNSWSRHFISLILNDPICGDRMIRGDFGFYDQSCASRIYDSDPKFSEHISVISGKKNRIQFGLGYAHSNENVPILHETGKDKSFYKTINPNSYRSKKYTNLDNI